MPKLLERRRKPRRKVAHITGPTWVMPEKVPGARADIRAKVVDYNESGIRIHLSLPLRANQVIVIKSQANVVPDGCVKARVVDCRALAGTGYTAGLTFERADDAGNAPGMEYYEVLQVSVKADVETIDGVYRFQAARYDPGNAKTGDAKMFQAVAEAYRVLSDPLKRAAYDEHLESRRKFQWPVFDQREASGGI